MNYVRTLAIVGLLAAMEISAPFAAAHADLILSQLVVDLTPGDNSRSDIEVWNNGKDRAFVAVDPREIIGPGTPGESSRTDPDPEKLGLLVSPARMILEPGQRKLLRIASIAPSDRERVYRVTVKPVVGQLSAETTGIKVLVGYDVLVLVRPGQVRAHVTASRSGNQVTLNNDGNVSVELVDGKQCDPSMKSCEPLPGGRLYADAKKIVAVAPDRRAQYRLKVGTKLFPVQF